MDLHLKKGFLQQSSALYDEMIRLATNDVIRRYLAFRIIVNAMSFEDILRKRQNLRLRKIRDVLLAHKQEPEFFEGYRATDEITDQSIKPLLGFMATETGAIDPSAKLPELMRGGAQTKFRQIVPQIFELYEKENLAGFRVINNFLCYTGTSVQEVTKGDLAGVFYRYNSSKDLFDLAQYIYNNTYRESDLTWTARHAKLDMVLHAQNMADCAIKDVYNSHSIEGLLEVMVAEQIGDATSLQALINDPKYKSAYGHVRAVRNKLIGHMDRVAPLAGLIAELDALPVTDVHDLVNMVDKAVHAVAKSHIAIRARYATQNQPLRGAGIKAIAGLKAKSYY